MPDRVFIDSNVVLYSLEKGSPAKQAAASRWLDYLSKSGLGVTTLQVLNEVTNVLLKRREMPTDQAFAYVDSFSAFGAAPVSRATTTAARIIRFETDYQWWDCILLASAVELQCQTFLSEDMQDGHQLYGLTIKSPFRHSPPTFPVH